jgi:hypothetical protein
VTKVQQKSLINKKSQLKVNKYVVEVKKKEGKLLLRSGIKRKTGFSFVFRSLIRTFENNLESTFVRE